MHYCSQMIHTKAHSTFVGYASGKNKSTFFAGDITHSDCLVRTSLLSVSGYFSIFVRLARKCLPGCVITRRIMTIQFILLRFDFSVVFLWNKNGLSPQKCNCNKFWGERKTARVSVSQRYILGTIIHARHILSGQIIKQSVFFFFIWEHLELNFVG